MTNSAGWLLITGIASLACSSQVFTSSNGSGVVDGGGENSGGSRNTGGAAGKINTGGARATGGRSGTGGIPTSTGGIVGDGGGSSSDSGVIKTEGGVVSPDSASGIVCYAPAPSFPTFEKGCGTDANCVLVRHQTDCCGSVLVMAINHSAVGAFGAAESICESQYPGCGCAPRGTQVEDGVLVPFDKENLIVAKCDNGICGSTYSGQKFACGTTMCADTDYCSVGVPGVPGGTSSYSCAPRFGCNTCSCLGVSSSCQCTESGSGITVTCYAP